MTKQFDVVIVGAGIAGLNIARLLGNYKLHVCLIDSKADITEVSFYTLGSSLEAKDYGLSENIIQATITEGFFHSRDVHFCRKGKVYILNKKVLYSELLNKCMESKVEIFTDTHIQNLKLSGNGGVESVTDDKGNIYKGKIFIDATGISGFFSRRFELQDKNFNIAEGLEYNVEYKSSQNQLHFFIGKLYQGGYAWLFPLNKERGVFGFGSFDPQIRKQLKQRLDEILETKLIKSLVKKDNDKVWGGTLPITDVKNKFVYKNVVCIGDCVSQVNPIIGEGHKFIMEAGVIAGPYINQSILEGNLNLLKGYENDWNQKYYKSYMLAKKLQKIAARASKSDLLADIGTIFLMLKRDKTIVNLIGGNITKKAIYLP